MTRRVLTFPIPAGAPCLPTRTPQLLEAVTPVELGRAVVAAEAELDDFARRLEPALDVIGVAEIRRIARSMAGMAG